MADLPARPLIPGPVETAVLFWRWLRRMRTALYLLGALGVAVLIGTVVPQRPNVPETVSRWLAGTEGPGEAAAQALHTLGMYDVFGAPWFIVLLTLLFVSLTACLIPRVRAFWRTARYGRPPLARDLGGRSHARSFTTALDPGSAVGRSRELLAGARYRTRTDEDADPRSAPVRSDPDGAVVAAPADDTSTTWSRMQHDPADLDASHGGPAARQVAGEKGHLAREGGSLAFHLSFFAILIGVVLGELTSFVGQVGVVERQAFSDTPVAYWTADPGRWWSPSDHTGFRLHLDDFEVEWTETGLPVEFTSDVTLTSSDGSIVREETTVVNDPIVFQRMKIHQLDWGWAPRIVIEDTRGDVAVPHDGYITMTATDQPGVWRGVVKAPAARPQIGVEVFLFPSAPQNEAGELVPTGRPQPEAPAIVYQVWEGDLQLDSVQGVDELDTTRMRQVARGGLRPGSSVEIADGVTLGFPELDQWVGFQVSRRPTVPLLLAGATVLLVGLLPALYAYRRRIWVEAAPDPRTGLTRITVAGHAYQRPQAFDDEFTRIVEELRERLETDPRPHDRAREVGVR